MNRRILILALTYGFLALALLPETSLGESLSGVQLARSEAEVAEQTGDMKFCTNCTYSFSRDQQGNCIPKCNCIPAGCYGTKTAREKMCNDNCGVLDPFACTCSRSGGGGSTVR